MGIQFCKIVMGCQIENKSKYRLIPQRCATDADDSLSISTRLTDVPCSTAASSSRFSHCTCLTQTIDALQDTIGDCTYASLQFIKIHLADGGVDLLHDRFLLHCF